jgi:two-component system LytT family sensor kinase
MHIFPLFQHMLVFLGLAYLFTKTAVFTDLVNNALSLPDKAIIYLVFASFSILGTIFSEPASELPDAIANTRAIGAVLGGLLGGSVVGFLVGFTGGVYRLLSMACLDVPLLNKVCGQHDPVNYIDIACVVATTIEGFFAGCIHYFQSRKGQIDKVLSPNFAFLITWFAETAHMIIILIFGWSEGLYLQTVSLINEIAFPMLIANSIGVGLIIYMIREQKKSCDIINSNAVAWRIANKTANSLFSGFRESSQSIAQIVRQETSVAAVAITDTESVLAYTGLGEDHHIVGSVIASTETKESIKTNKVIFSNGIDKTYQCRRQTDCPLGSALVIPLQNADHQVFGTIKLYEAKNKLFRNNNVGLGKEIAQLLSTRFLQGDNAQRKSLEAQEQLKLLRAQIKPHFLYNALATIAAIIKKQPDEARDLLLNLSDFFRVNLKTPEDTTTLKQEYQHLQSYLKIEKARFKDELIIKIDLPDELMNKQLPVFTLQPLVENAIEHGTSQRIQVGIISIRCFEQDNTLVLVVEDNAGKYQEPEEDSDGIGLTLDKRIKLIYGKNYGISVEYKTDQYTRFVVRLPNRI